MDVSLIDEMTKMRGELKKWLMDFVDLREKSYSQIDL